MPDTVSSPRTLAALRVAGFDEAGLAAIQEYIEQDHVDLRRATAVATLRDAAVRARARAKTEAVAPSSGVQTAKDLSRLYTDLADVIAAGRLAPLGVEVPSV